jgi:hypothetical protein
MHIIKKSLVTGFSRPIFTWRINGQDFNSTIASTSISITANVQLDNLNNPNTLTNSVTIVNLLYTNYGSTRLNNGLVAGLLDIFNRLPRSHNT